MSIINVFARFNGKDLETGLARVKGQAERLGADLDKKFSVGSLARQALGGFIGINLATKLVDPFREAAAYAAKIADASRALAGITLEGLMGRNGPERNVALLTRENERDETRLAQISEALADLPDFSDPAAIAKNPSLLNPFVYQVKKELYDSLTGERTALTATIATRGNTIDDLKRGIERATRANDNAREAILDQREVRAGTISAVEAAEREAARKSADYDYILSKRGDGVEAEAAFNEVLRANDAVKIARFAFEKDRVQGIAPQMSATSLAQLGGGGNVNVFGGREGDLLSENRQQTALLRSIDGKLGSGRRMSLDITVDSVTPVN